MKNRLILHLDLLSTQGENGSPTLPPLIRWTHYLSTIVAVNICVCWIGGGIPSQSCLSLPLVSRRYQRPISLCSANQSQFCLSEGPFQVKIGAGDCHFTCPSLGVIGNLIVDVDQECFQAPPPHFLYILSTYSCKCQRHWSTGRKWMCSHPL